MGINLLIRFVFTALLFSNQNTHAREFARELTPKVNPVQECFDIFLPFHEDDKRVFLGVDSSGGVGSGLHSFRKHVKGYRKIFIISKWYDYLGTQLDAKTEWFDEANFSFKAEDFNKGWDYQQVIKLLGPHEIPDLCETFVVLDADDIFVKDIHYVTTDTDGQESFLYVYAKAVFHPIFSKHDNKAVNFLLGLDVSGPSCSIHHQMVMQKSVLQKLGHAVSRIHGGKDYLEILKAMFKSDMLMSEYGLYFFFMYENFPERMRITHLPYVHAQSIDECGLDVLNAFGEESDVVFVTCHDHYHEPNPICINSVDRCTTSLNQSGATAPDIRMQCMSLARIKPRLRPAVLV